MQRFHSKSKCFPSILRRKRYNHRSFWIFVRGNLWKGNHMNVVMPLFSKSSVFKMISFHTKTQRRRFQIPPVWKAFLSQYFWYLCLIMFLRYFRNTRGGGWSSDGCELKSSNFTHTVCTCAHLTAFAVLSDLNLQVWLNVVCISIFSFTRRIVRKCGIVPFWIMCRLTVLSVLCLINQFELDWGDMANSTPSCSSRNALSFLKREIETVSNFFFTG